MRIGFALLRKEADYFRSKGLYKDAQDLYARFVASQADIDADIKSAIEEELKLIESKINGSGADAAPDPPADRVDPASNGAGGGGDEGESDPGSGTQDQHEGLANRQEEKADVESPEWIEGMADIYSLVAKEADQAPAENMEAAVSTAAEPPPILPISSLPGNNGPHRGFTSKSYAIGIAAILLLAVSSIWLFTSLSDRRNELAQQAAMIVFKKMPSLSGNEALSLFFNHRPEYQPDTRPEQQAGLGDPQLSEDAVEKQEKQNMTTRQASGFSEDAKGSSDVAVVEENDIPSSMEEPDPTSAIDYVLKKRRPDI